MTGKREQKRKRRLRPGFFLILLLISAMALAGFLHSCQESAADPGPGPTGSPPVQTPVQIPTQTPSPTPPPTPDLSTRAITIQMAGDILLHGKPVRAAKTGTAGTGVDAYDFSPYFSAIRPYITGDLAICNMESPVDAFGGNQQISSYPMFNVPVEILTGLKSAGFTFVTTANNHAYDKKYAGLVATRNNIAKSGLLFTGTNETQEEYDTYAIVDIEGVKIGVIAYSDADNGLESYIPADKRPFTMRRFTSASLDSVPDMIADMAACRAAGADFIILSLHWGAEYVDKPTDTQKEIARALCDGGADILLGGHSHCVQPVEWHERSDGTKSLILYSLGNFFADQIDMSTPIPKTQYGALVSVSLYRDAEGVLQWGGASYLPTLTYRYKSTDNPTGIDYRLLPVFDSGEGRQRPDLFASDAEWAKQTKAFAHVTKIMGDAIALSPE